MAPTSALSKYFVRTAKRAPGLPPAAICARCFPMATSPARYSASGSRKSASGRADSMALYAAKLLEVEDTCKEVETWSAFPIVT